MRNPNALQGYAPEHHPTADGARAGVTAEGVKAAARGTKQMTLQEARQILGVESGATWEEITKVGECTFA